MNKLTRYSLLITHLGVFLAGFGLKKFQGYSINEVSPEPDSRLVTSSKSSPHKTLNNSSKNSAIKDSEDSGLQPLGEPFFQSLEDMCIDQPELLTRLNISLFNDSLEPRTQAWEFLGIDEKKVEEVRNQLFNIRRKLQARDLENFQVLRDSDSKVVMGFEALPKDERQVFADEVRNAFGTVLPPKLAEGISSKFLESSQVSFGAILGRPRILEIIPVADELTKHGYKYEINTSMVNEGYNLNEYTPESARLHIRRQSRRTVESLPENWSHIFSD